MNCPRVDTVFFITEKAACPFFPALRSKKLYICSLGFNDDCKIENIRGGKPLLITFSS